MSVAEPQTAITQTPDFVFPVVAWAPEPATVEEDDDGTREFLTLRDLTTTYFPQTDLRLGWTFVDAEGNSWTAISSHVAGRADSWWARMLPRWLYPPRWRLDLKFAEQAPIAFDEVKGRLLDAVAANPQAYRDYARERAEDLREASSLRDLIRSEEELAIQRLRPSSLWWQWLFWEGRCSRLTFVGALAVMSIVAWLAMVWLLFAIPASLLVLVPALLLWMSAPVRRLHDLRRTGWWIGAWFLLSFLCGLVHDSASNPEVKDVAALVWQISTLGALAFLALAPGSRGPNRYGPARNY